MTNGSDRLDRIERIMAQVGKRQDEMAARQQYHDEAFERHDSQIKLILEAIAVDSENIQAQCRIEEMHNRRREGRDGGGAV